MIKEQNRKIEVLLTERDLQEMINEGKVRYWSEDNIDIEMHPVGTIEDREKQQSQADNEYDENDNDYTDTENDEMLKMRKALAAFYGVDISKVHHYKDDYLDEFYINGKHYEVTTKQSVAQNTSYWWSELNKKYCYRELL